MNQQQQTYKDQQEKITERLSLITSLPSKKYFGLAGRFINMYGFEFVIGVLEHVAEGMSVRYVCGALRNEYCKTVDMSDEYIRKLSGMWK
uniref:Uncharacterized protein n=2 Tax=viral metagenome TaxID=1070528 RepID=A0A6H1ZKV2_9ZZZZ